jgi:hypothetical protein
MNIMLTKKMLKEPEALEHLDLVAASFKSNLKKGAYMSPLIPLKGPTDKPSYKPKRTNPFINLKRTNA